MSEHKVNINNFDRLSQVDFKSKSYKLEVSVSDYMSLYEPSKWPTGICIGQFYIPKAQRKSL